MTELKEVDFYITKIESEKERMKYFKGKEWIEVTGMMILDDENTKTEIINRFLNQKPVKYKLDYRKDRNQIIITVLKLT